MAAPQDEWSATADEAIDFLIVDSSGKTIHTFKPKFAESIFENGTIFGYKGLKINIRFHANDMRPHLQIQHTRKFKPVGETEPTDVAAILEELFPKTATVPIAQYTAAIAEPASNSAWVPPGTKVRSWNHNGKIFEVWSGSLANAAVQQLMRRIQITIPLFIEGGRILDLQDTESELDRWTVYYMFQKTAPVEDGSSPYVFLGLCTVYRFWSFPYRARSAGTAETTKAEGKKPVHATVDFSMPLPKLNWEEFYCRSRISQFLVLPPYQKSGNGAMFLETICSVYRNDPKTVEITVEDPNEDFDDLRDYHDLHLLRQIPEFTALRLDTKYHPRNDDGVPGKLLDAKSLATLEGIRINTKIAPNQFARMVELQLLSYIPIGVRQSMVHVNASKLPNLKAKEHEYHLWKLWTKVRIYKIPHNRDQLAQLDRVPRIEELEKVIGSLEAHYGKLLRDVEKFETKLVNAAVEEASGGEDEGNGEPPAKRQKV